MRRIPDFNIKTAVGLAAALLFLIYATLELLSWRTPGEDEAAGSVARMELATYYEISIDGRPAIYADDYDDWTTARLSTNGMDIPARVKPIAATWARTKLKPWGAGRLLAEGRDTRPWEKRQNAHIDSTMRNRLNQLKTKTHVLERRMEELRYFMRVHNVTDEGYNTIADYETQTERELLTADSIVRMLENSIGRQKLTVRSVRRYTLLYNIQGREERHECRILSVDTVRRTCLLRTDIATPDSVCPQYARAWAPRLLRWTTQMGLVMPRDTMHAELTTPQGHYEGELSSQGQRSGHGVLRSVNGKIYDGMWDNGLRNGFGISLDSNGDVRIGEWKDDVYKGERPTYTADHVYGIDISRHQHEKGRKRYTIDWSRLRITHLGAKSQKRISGEVDYPVSFCFIKCTEGTTVTNAYYAADCRQARRRAIRVGSYHFFSVKSPIEQQARHFLHQARFHAGDLPPVLDVEPTEAQIEAYGGTGAIIGAMRTWLRIVERQVGVRPILYLNQNFVTKHLATAPDLKRDYKIWIARYGEYKPDVRLVVWQLSPDGRVAGIHGDVDINIFNGYADQYEEFLASDTIR